MPDGLVVTLTLLSALGSAVVAGVLFAFSVFVMEALARLPGAHGLAAMQSINAAALSPLFMVALFGTALACLALAVTSLFMMEAPAAVYRLVGSMLYLVAILLTIVYHVPRNEALATVDPHSADAAAHWTRYVRGWTAWNHVRTAAALAAAVTLTLALCAG